MELNLIDGGNPVGQASGFSLKEIIDLPWFLFQQTTIIVLKNARQLQRDFRKTLKNAILIPLFWLIFVGAFFLLVNQSFIKEAYYDIRPLYPLSDQGPFGVFNLEGKTPVFDFDPPPNILLFSPNNHAGVLGLIADLQKTYPYIDVKGAVDASGVDDAYYDNLYSTWSCLVFDLDEYQIKYGNFSTPNNKVQYTIRNAPYIPVSTDYFDSEVYNEDRFPAVDYALITGYLTLQNYVRTWITTKNSGKIFSVESTVQRYPQSPIYLQKPEANTPYFRYGIWKWTGAVVIGIALLTPILGSIITVIRERETKMVDLLEISGMMSFSYYAANIITVLVIGCIAMGVVLGMAEAFGIFTSYHITPYSSVMTLYILNIAASGFVFGYVLPYSDYFALPLFVFNIIICIGGTFIANDYTMTESGKLFVGFLFPQVSLNMGVFIIENFVYENQDTIVDYNWTDRNKPSLSAVNSIQIGSIIFYMFISMGWPFRSLVSFLKSTISTTKIDNSELIDKLFPCDVEERAVDNRRVFLDVRDVCHTYPDGTNAVRNMSFQVHEGEVLSFLGANGAGKSTTMGMLCGNLDVTSGAAIINGFNISTAKTHARRSLGICTQQDVIWHDLSVEEHLYIFAALRGLSYWKLKDDVSRMVASLGYPEKAKSLAGTLSGGQKRRLCAGISLIGGNKVVYLDEPTAGLDPVSRRQLWELIEKNRAGRAILLTTHFMDEADILGDRIAIVKEGRLRCLGSSKFLKENFGLGYLMRCSLSPKAEPDSIFQIVKSEIPVAGIASSAGAELALRMPRDSVPAFPKLFEILEKRKADLGLLSFGIETTTLEEVFMRIINEDVSRTIANRKEANAVLGADGKTYRNYEDNLVKEDSRSDLFGDSEIDKILIRGSATADSVVPLRVQVPTIFHKRFLQCIRSIGQLIMIFAVPVALSAFCGYLLSIMPTQVLDDNPAQSEIYFNGSGAGLFPTEDRYTTFVAGPPILSMEWAKAAFPGDSLTYVGSTYEALFSNISTTASTMLGQSSTASVMFYAQNNFTVLYNASYPMNFIGSMSALFNAAVGSNNTFTFVEFCQNLPFNLVGAQFNTALFVALLMALWSGSIGSGISTVLGDERVNGIKHQQLASGTSNAAYWTGNMIFEFLVMLVNVLFFAIMLNILNPEFYDGEGFNVVVGSGVLTIAALIPRYYILCLFVDDVKMAQTIFFYGALFSMFIMIFVYFNTIALAGNNPNSTSALSIGYVLTVLEPMFGWFILVLFQHDFLAVRSTNNDDSVWVLGAGVVEMLVISVIIYSGLFLWFEFRKSLFVQVSKIKKATARLFTGKPRLPRKKSSLRLLDSDDVDVVEERNRVKEIYDSGSIDRVTNAILIHNIRKVYYGKGTIPTKVAVNDVSVNIPQGEIFGLLGANGAGKTTLLKMVSGLEAPSAGEAYINGYDISLNTMKAQRSMGLCPQFDTLIGQLSVKENLMFFGRVKGVPSAVLSDVVDAFMVALNIKQYESKLTQRLSGGNRRKVSLAVALIGCPPTVYLDEPSTGLDPVASRLMWRLLIRLASRKQNAIVLTTHNMLECEAVCSRICMMKAGELVCLGDSQHLRTIHGTGFLLEIVLKDVSGANCDKAKAFVVESFDGAVIVDEHALMLNFEIPREAIPSLSQAFRLLESRKSEIGIANYSLSQSSLEQVFLKQIRPKEDEESSAPKVPPLVPNGNDYFICFICILLSVFFPGLHHFKMGNFWLGLEYFVTYNHVLVGSIFDLLEMIPLVQRSVQQQNAHLTTCVCICPCCSCLPWCATNEVAGEPKNGCMRAQTRAPFTESTENTSPESFEYVEAKPVNPLYANAVPFSQGGGSVESTAGRELL